MKLLITMLGFFALYCLVSLAWGAWMDLCDLPPFRGRPNGWGFPWFFFHLLFGILSAVGFSTLFLNLKKV